MIILRRQDGETRGCPGLIIDQETGLCDTHGGKYMNRPQRPQTLLGATNPGPARYTRLPEKDGN